MYDPEIKLNSPGFGYKLLPLLSHLGPALWFFIKFLSCQLVLRFRAGRPYKGYQPGSLLDLKEGPT